MALKNCLTQLNSRPRVSTVFYWEYIGNPPSSLPSSLPALSHPGQDHNKSASRPRRELWEPLRRSENWPLLDINMMTSTFMPFSILFQKKFWWIYFLSIFKSHWILYHYCWLEPKMKKSKSCLQETTLLRLADNSTNTNEKPKRCHCCRNCCLCN